MTWPAAVQTVRLTVGQTHDALGVNVAASLTVRADFGGASTITWAATSDTMTTLVGSGGEVELPPVDQIGWVDPTGRSIQGWAYVAELVLRVGSQIKVLTRRFQVLVGQDSVDFFDLPDLDHAEPVLAPIAPVTSVNGQTGAVHIAGGGGGSAAEVHDFTNSALWSIPHSLGRRPSVSIFTTTGEMVEADVFASATVVTATFPDPISGSAVLT